jgi:hypothetical protein
MVLFLTRMQNTGLQLNELILLHGFAEHVPPTETAVAFIRDMPVFVSALAYYATTVGQYVLHGFFEFFVVLHQKSPNDPLLLGRYEFDLINRLGTAWEARSGFPVTDINVYNPRSGLFSTFWGPAFIDFGMLMVPYAFLLGLVIDYFRVQVQRGDLLALPLYALFIVQVAVSPYINGFAMTAASYVNMGLLLFWIIGRSCYSRTRNMAFAHD